MIARSSVVVYRHGPTSDNLPEVDIGLAVAAWVNLRFDRADNIRAEQALEHPCAPTRNYYVEDVERM